MCYNDERINSLKGQDGRYAMTVIASVKVRNGIVLATDSMSQLIIRNERGKSASLKHIVTLENYFERRWPKNVVNKTVKPKVNLVKED